MNDWQGDCQDCVCAGIAVRFLRHATAAIRSEFDLTGVTDKEKLTP